MGPGYYNMDCMEGMKQFPDKFFDLAIVDPNYGIGEDGAKNHSRDKLAKATKYISKEWDKEQVSKVILDEIMRVSKNQIIWGGNHFISKIAYDSSCWIVWDKQNGDNDFADCELAWTSFKTTVRIFHFRWSGFLQGDMRNKEFRIHPTQKPVSLYRWLLQNYAKPGDKLISTHVGSASDLIAFEMEGYFDYWGFELDPDYYRDSTNRLEQWRKSKTIGLFEPEELRKAVNF